MIARGYIYLVFLSLVFSFDVANATSDEFDRNYTITGYRSCNSTFMGEDRLRGSEQPGNCSVELWHGVDLDHLKSLSFTVSANQSVTLSITDLNGQSWDINSSYCLQNPDECKLEFVEDTENQRLEIHFTGYTNRFYDAKKALNIYFNERPTGGIYLFARDDTQLSFAAERLISN